MLDFGFGDGFRIGTKPLETLHSVLFCGDWYQFVDVFAHAPAIALSFALRRPSGTSPPSLRYAVLLLPVSSSHLVLDAKLHPGRLQAGGRFGGWRG